MASSRGVGAQRQGSGVYRHGAVPRPPAPASAAVRRPPTEEKVKETYTVAISPDFEAAALEAKYGEPLHVAQRLIGEYEERDMNHGKKVFATKPREGSSGNILIYYWDDRHGPDNQGWWFGSKLGGNQVWARNPEPTPLPPSTGWHIPYDGQPLPCFSVTSTRVLQLRAWQQEKVKQARANQEAREEKANEEQRRVIAEKEMQEVERLKSKQLPAVISKVRAAEEQVEKAVIIADMLSSDDLEAIASDLKATEEAVANAEKALEKAQKVIEGGVVASQRMTEGARELGLAELKPLDAQVKEMEQKLAPLKTLRQDLKRKQATKSLMERLMREAAEAEVSVEALDRSVALLKEEDEDEELPKEALNEVKQLLQKANRAVTAASKSVKVEHKDISEEAQEELPLLRERVVGSTERLKELEESAQEMDKRSMMQGIVRQVEAKVQVAMTALDKALEAEVAVEAELASALPADDDDGTADAEAPPQLQACDVAATAVITTTSAARTFVSHKQVELRRLPTGIARRGTEKVQSSIKELDAIGEKIGELKSRTAAKRQLLLMEKTRRAVERAEAKAEELSKTAIVLKDDAKLLDYSTEEVKEAAERTLRAEAVATAAVKEAQKLLTARQVDSRSKDAVGDIKAELTELQGRIGGLSSKIGADKRLADTVNHRMGALRSLRDTATKLDAAEEKVASTLDMISMLAAEMMPAVAAPELEEASAEQAAGDGTTESHVNQALGHGADAGIDEKAAEERSARVKAANTAFQEAQMAMKSCECALESKVHHRLGAASEDSERLSARAKLLQEQLTDGKAQLQKLSEQVGVEGILREVRSQMRETEASLAAIKAATFPFTTGIERLPAAETGQALEALQGAMEQTQKLMANTKACIAAKRIEARRLSSAAASSTSSVLADLQLQLDEVGKRAQEHRSQLSRWRDAAMRHEAVGTVEAVEQQVAAAETAVQRVSDFLEGMSVEDMQTACRDVDAEQTAARNAATRAQALLRRRLEELKKSSPASDVVADFAKLPARVAAVVKALDQQRESLTHSEHRFVSQKLVIDATNAVRVFEEKLDGAKDAAAPLLGEGGKDLVPSITLTQLSKALQAHCKATSTAPAALFAELAEEEEASKSSGAAPGPVIGPKRWIEGLQRLAADAGSGVPTYTPEELGEIFRCLDVRGGGRVREPDFLALLRTVYCCTSSVSVTTDLQVKSSKTLGKLEVDDTFEATSEPERDPTTGLLRVQGRAARAGVTGWATTRGNQGTVFLEARSPYEVQLSRTEQAFAAAQEAAMGVFMHVKQKLRDLAAVKGGPLAQSKAKLTELQAQVGQLEALHKELKAKLAASKKQHEQHIEREAARQKQAAEPKAEMA